MPAPFEFSPYHDANADQTIAALLQDRGRIQAEGARASGNAWAGAVQSIGQQVGQIPQQIQQQKEQGIRDAATQAQTAATTAATAERVSKQQQDAYVDRIMKDALVPDPQTGTTKIDRAKFEANLVSGGQGHLYKEWQPALDAMEDKAMRRAAVNRELWADVLVGIHRAGDTPQSILTGMAYLKSNGAISDAAYTSAQAQLEQDASPTGIKAFVDQAGSKIPEFGAALTTFQKQQADLAKSTADTAKTEAYTKKINAEVAGTLPATPAQKQTAEYQAAMLKVAQQNAASNAARAAAAGQAKTSGLQPDAVEYTATQYRILGPSGIPTRIETADRVKILNTAAKQAKALGQSPAMAVQRQAAFKADSAALTKMRTMSSAAEAFETKAIAQADLVEQLSKNVKRTDWPIINGVLLSGKAATGNTDVHLFANGLLTFTTEYAKLMEGSTGSVAGSSEGGRRDAARLISTALNNGTIEKTLAQMKWEMRQTMQGYDVVMKHIAERQIGAPVPAASVGADSNDPLGILKK